MFGLSSRSYDLILYSVGVVFFFTLSSFFFKWIVNPYQYDDSDVKRVKCFEFWRNNPILLFTSAFGWLGGRFFGGVGNQIQKRSPKSFIQTSILCALTIVISSELSNLTTQYDRTNLSVVTMAKMAGVVPVVMIGSLISRVKSTKLKLRTPLIALAVILAIAGIFFMVSDPLLKYKYVHTETKFNIILVISVLVESLVPQFQAQLKQKYKPSPIEFMTLVNKYIFISTLVRTIIFKQFEEILLFAIINYDKMAWIVLPGVLSVFGQILLYKIVVNFKQHFVPFLILFKRVTLWLVTAIYSKHQISQEQYIAAFVIFVVIVYEFFFQMGMTAEQNKSPVSLQQLHQNQRAKLSSSQTNQQTPTFQI